MPASSFTLYGSPASTATNRVRLMLADASFTDYDFVTLDFQKGEHKSPQHLSRNPYGRVPVLTMSDGFTLYESRAICKFLAAKYSLPYVPPQSDLVETALFDQAEGAEASHFSPPAGVISLEKFAKVFMGMESDATAVDAARKLLAAHLDVVDGILAGQEYMAGNAFSLVDIFYLPLIERLCKTGEGGLIESRKNVRSWRERCLSRPAVKKVLGELLSLEDIKKRSATSKS